MPLCPACQYFSCGAFHCTVDTYFKVRFSEAMDIQKEHTLQTPGHYLQFERPLTPEEIIKIETALGEIGVGANLVEVEKTQTDLLPFDPEETGLRLGKMSKEDFVGLVITYAPRSKNTPNRPYNVLARNTWGKGKDKRAFVDHDAKLIDLDLLYEYASSGRRTLMGGGEVFQEIIVQILNHQINVHRPKKT